MSKTCEKCGQTVRTPIVVDAIGREVRITDVILWLRPVMSVRRNGVSIQLTEPVGFDPIVIVPSCAESSTLTGEYCIEGRPYRAPNCPVDIRGEVGKPNPRIYKIADGLGSL